MQTTRTLLAMAAIATLATSAQAAVILSDSFDGYADQAAFEVAWPATVVGAPGLLSTEQSVSAPNSVSIPANGTTATRRSRATFAESTYGIWTQLVWSFDFLETDTTGLPRQYVNLQDTTAPGGTNQLVSMGITNTQAIAANGGNLYMARILGYTPEDTGGASGSYFKLNDFPGAEREAGWHNLKVILTTNDGLSTDYSFYVDNVLVETVDNVGTAASIRSFENIALGSGVSSAAGGAYYDNLYLAVVPEPTSFALVGLAGLAIKRRR